MAAEDKRRQATRVPAAAAALFSFHHGAGAGGPITTAWEKRTRRRVFAVCAAVHEHHALRTRLLPAHGRGQAHALARVHKSRLR
jgi:hypothetical protein